MKSTMDCPLIDNNENWVKEWIREGALVAYKAISVASLIACSLLAEKNNFSINDEASLRAIVASWLYGNKIIQ